MEQIVIRGGIPLNGEVSISGAKNAALGILAGAILADEDVTIHNLPDVKDVNTLLDAIRETGAKVQRTSKHDVTVNGSTIRSFVVDNGFIRQMRAGYYLLGSLLGKYREAEVAMPGGCSIGSRPIDQHLKGFEALGAVTEVRNSMICAKADELAGANVSFDVVSVGATINVMLAAVFASGRTVLENVAKEPHVVDVANFLNSMGARIKGAGTDVIRIDGVRRLHGTEYTVIPDQIEAATFLMAGAATRGCVTVKNVIPKHLDCITSKLQEIGCRIDEYDDAVTVSMNRPLRSSKVRTQPYPGFPTDLQPQIVVVLAQAQGVSTVTETIFENRYKYVGELKRMGADISVENGTVAIVNGVSELHGAQLVAPDLRAGAALVIAGLAAQGDSVVEDNEYIIRGYEDFVLKLKSLGGDVDVAETDAEVKKILLKKGMV